MRISATHLQNFNMFTKYDWYTEERLLAAIRNEETPNENVLLGRAFHALFEHPEKYREDDCYRVGDVTLPHGVVDLCLRYIDRSAPFEIKTTKVYTIGGEQVKVVSRIDQLNAGVIYEFKTLWTPFKHEVIDRYTGSVQWQYYLDAFEALYLQYIVFNLQKKKKDGTIRLDGVYPIQCYAHPTIHQNCVSHLRDFLSYRQFRNLEEHFADKDDDPLQIENVFYGE